MTRTEASHRFFETPIVVQLGTDPLSQDQRDWLSKQIGEIPEATLQFNELDADSEFGATIFHMGDVITGQRLGDFVSYARWLGGH